MTMQVRDAMNKAVLIVGPTHTLRQVATQMTQRRVGSAVVLDPDGEGIGILTERDVLYAVGRGLDPDVERAESHLTWDVVYASPHWTLGGSAAASGTSWCSTTPRCSGSSRSATSCGSGPTRARPPRPDRDRPVRLVVMTSEQLISFARGAPSLDIVDVAGLKAAAARAFDTDAAGITAYGTSVGYPPLRRWIAARHGVAVEQVLVTNGSMQADAFLFDHLVRPGDDVVVEKPTYDRTLLSLRQRGARVHQVTLGADGIDVDELRALLELGVRPKLAHIIPNFQNPAGVTLSVPKRQALLALTAEFGFTLFEDDPYGDLH